MNISKLEFTLAIVILLEIVVMTAQAFYHPLNSVFVDGALITASIIGLASLSLTFIKKDIDK